MSDKTKKVKPVKPAKKIDDRIALLQAQKPKEPGFDRQQWWEKMSYLRGQIRVEKRRERAEQLRIKEGRLTQDEYWKRYNVIKTQQGLNHREIQRQIKREQEQRAAAMKIRQIRTTEEQFKGKPKITRTTIDLDILNKPPTPKDYRYHLDILSQYTKNMLESAQFPIKFGLLYKTTMTKDNLTQDFIFPHTKEHHEYTFADILNQSEINKAVDDRIVIINQGIENFTNHGSLWQWVKSVEAYIKIIPIRRQGSSYCDLPSWINNKKCCINVKNDDNKCFLWAILSAIHPQEKDGQRVSKYKQYENEINMTNIEYPVCCKNYEKFERQNKPINVYE